MLKLSTGLAAILLLITFIAFIIYLVKGKNMIIGFLVMAILWGFIAGRNWKDILGVIQSGVTGYGNIGFTIIFGSWFGQILTKTGITSTIIRKAVELGGDKPLVVAILLSLVTTAIFTSSFGSGVVIAVGIIILPILFSLGIPKALAVGSFIMSIGTGVMMNVVHFNQLATIIKGYEYDQFITFALIAMAIDMIFIILMLAFGIRKAKLGAAWAVPVDNLPEASVPLIACISPILPILMVILFKWPIIPCFMISILIALILTKRIAKPKEALSFSIQCIYDGVADVGILIIMLTMINTFQLMSESVAPIFQELLGPVIPESTLWLTVAVAILAPLSLFRGPLTFWGTGVAVITVIASLGIFPVNFLFPLMCIPTNFMATAICPTQGWNMWGLSYGKVPIKEHFKTTFVWAWLVCIVTSFVTYFMYGM